MFQIKYVLGVAAWRCPSTAETCASGDCVCVCVCVCERALTDGFNNKQHLNLIHVIEINIWNEDTRSTAEL
jgi:hypothetical protein